MLFYSKTPPPQSDVERSSAIIRRGPQFKVQGLSFVRRSSTLKTPNYAHKTYLFVLCDRQNKQNLFTCTTATGWSVRWGGVVLCCVVLCCVVLCCVVLCCVHCAVGNKCHRKLYQGVRCLGWQSIICSVKKTWACTMELLENWENCNTLLGNKRTFPII
jgi:hypothetical protein